MWIINLDIILATNAFTMQEKYFFIIMLLKPCTLTHTKIEVNSSKSGAVLLKALTGNLVDSWRKVAL